MRRRLASLGLLVSGRTPEELARLQAAQLRRLVSHAYERVPYYRALFAGAGLHPTDIRDASDLVKIPPTSKRDLLEQPPEALVERGVDPETLIVRRTSGASGEPFSIRRTWLEERILTATRRRAMHEVGLRPTHRIALIEAHRPVHPRDRQWLSRLLANLGVFRTVSIDCRAPAGEIARLLGKLAPDVVQGFPVVLERVADMLLAASLRPRPRLVLVGGEVLTPRMRERISLAFGATIVETYGSHEFNMIACECPATGELHVSEGLILEVLRDGRAAAPGERGEVVATNLHAFAMPFIRYRLGDVVTRGGATCPCGRALPTIRKVHGRMLDYFSLPGGRSAHPYDIILPILRIAPWIRQYRMLQERVDRVVLEAVPRHEPSTQEMQGLAKVGEQSLGGGVEFVVRVVGELPIEPSGKFRVARSLVGSSYDGIDWDT